MAREGKRKFSLGDIVRKLNEDRKPTPTAPAEGASALQPAGPFAAPHSGLPAGGDLPRQPRLGVEPAPVSPILRTDTAVATAEPRESAPDPALSSPLPAASAAPTQPSPLFEDDEEEQFDIFRYLGVILRRKAIIIISAVVAVLFSLHSYLTGERYFVSHARMLFSPGYQEIVTDNSMPLEVWGDREKRINTHLELLTSNREVLKRLAESLGGRIMPGEIKGRLTVKRGDTNGEKNNIIELSYTHTNAVLARDVLNGLCAEYIAYIQEVNAQDITKMLAKFDAQIDKVQTELTRKEDALRTFKESNRLVQLSSETNLVVSKLSDMEVALQQTEMQFLESREKLMALNTQIGQQEISVVQSITYEDPYRNRLADLEFELSTLLAEYSEDHFKVRSVQQQIEKMKEAISSNVKKRARSETFVKNPIRESLLQSLVDLSIEKASLDAKRTAQQQMIETLDKELLHLPSLEQQYIGLQRETESLVQTLRMLKDRYEKAKIKRDSQDSDLKILEPAQAPTAAFSSVKANKILSGLIIGLVMGIALAFALEYFDQTIKEPRDVEKATELPLLGIVPFIEADRALIEGTMDKGKTVLEPFRALRANLKHIAIQNKYRTFMICSALKGEGKTTLAANLAITFAMDGKKVILVDGDLRRSQLHNLFNMPKEVGFSDYMMGTADIAKILKPTKHENLHVVTSGERPHNPAELLGTPRFDRMMEELRNRSDLLIYDSPALLPVSDALTMAPKMDCCLMIARTLWTPIKGARQARMQLNRIGSNVIGAILNGVAHSRGYYPYYYGYYGYYSYSYKYSYDDEQHGGGPVRELGLRLESRIKDVAQEARSVLPRLVGRMLLSARILSRRKAFWALLFLLALSSAARFALRNTVPVKKPVRVRYLRPLPAAMESVIPSGSARPLEEAAQLQPGPASPSSNSPAVAQPQFPLDSLLAWQQSAREGDSVRFFQFYDSLDFQYPGGGSEQWRTGDGAGGFAQLTQGESIAVDTMWSEPAARNGCRASTDFSVHGRGDTTRVRFIQIWSAAHGHWRIIREKREAIP